MIMFGQYPQGVGKDNSARIIEDCDVIDLSGEEDQNITNESIPLGDVNQLAEEFRGISDGKRKRTSINNILKPQRLAKKPIRRSASKKSSSGTNKPSISENIDGYDSVPETLNTLSVDDAEDHDNNFHNEVIPQLKRPKHSLLSILNGQTNKKVVETDNEEPLGNNTFNSDSECTINDDDISFVGSERGESNLNFDLTNSTQEKETVISVNNELISISSQPDYVEEMPTDKRMRISFNESHDMIYDYGSSDCDGSFSTRMMKQDDSMVVKFQSDKLKKPEKIGRLASLNGFIKSKKNSNNKRVNNSTSMRQNSFLVELSFPKSPSQTIRVEEEKEEVEEEEEEEKKIESTPRKSKKRQTRTDLRQLLSGQPKKSKKSQPVIEIHDDPILLADKLTLKIPKELAISIKKKMDDQDSSFNNPFYTSGSSGGGVSKISKTLANPNSFFQEVYNRGKAAAEAKKIRDKLGTAVIKRNRKENFMEVRWMDRDEFHVIPEEEKPKSIGDFSEKRIIKTGDEYPIDYSQLFFDECVIQDAVGESQYTSGTIVLLDAEISEIGRASNPKFTRFQDSLLDDEQKFFKETQLWCEVTKPTQYQHCLINPECSESIYYWLKDSFQLLEKNYQISWRQKFLKELFDGKQKKNVVNDNYLLDDFVVADSETFENTDDDMETRFPILSKIDEHTPYIPLMIVTGPVGCGKTSSIYASVKQLHGYVHEINTNQEHSKKALQKLLKELCTTKTVHQGKHPRNGGGFFQANNNNNNNNNNNSNKSRFQNGIILFENVDVLFKSQDRGFWELLNSILCITRKPIVMTCGDPLMIPSNLVKIATQQHSYLEVSLADGSELQEYLKMVSYLLGYVVEDQIIEDLIKTHRRDIRECLNNLQFICTTSGRRVLGDWRRKSEFVSVEYSKDYIDDRKRMMVDEQKKLPAGLRELSDTLEMLSISDVISRHSTSMIDKLQFGYHEEEENNDDDDDEEENKKGQIDDYLYDNNLMDDEMLMGNPDCRTQFIKQDYGFPTTLEFELNIGFELRKHYLSAYYQTYRINLNKKGEISFEEPRSIDEELNLYYMKMTKLQSFNKRAYWGNFGEFLKLKLYRTTNRITRRRSAMAQYYYYNDQQVCQIMYSCNSPLAILLELGPMLRVLAHINVFIYERNRILQENSTALEYENMIGLRIVKPLMFELDPQMNQRVLGTSCLKVEDQLELFRKMIVTK